MSVVTIQVNDQNALDPWGVELNFILIGRLEVAYEMWEDWDEDCHGPMDTKSNRREYPENFKWSCCKENGNSGGCREDEHQRKSQKRRV